MSSVFSPLNFVKEQIDTSSILEYSSDNYDNSFFMESLNFIKESNAEYNSAQRSLYRAFLEYEKDPELITESFSGFFIKIKEIIAKFLNFIKSLFERFITKLCQFVKSDKYIIKNKDKFKTFGEPHNFSFIGYNFTISPNIPSTQPLYTFTNDFLEMGLTRDDFEGKKQPEIASIIKSKYNNLANSLNDYWYDDFRKQTINVDYKVTQSDFANELFCIFRDGTSEKGDIDVTSSYITSCLAEFENYKQDVKQTKSEKANIESDYTKLQRQIDNVVHRNKDRSPEAIIATLNMPAGTPLTGYTISTEILEALDLFVKAKTNQVQEMSNIHILAFSSKLDAMADKYKQNKSVLYKALYNIQGKLKEV